MILYVLSQLKCFQIAYIRLVVPDTCFVLLNPQPLSMLHLVLF